MELAQHLPENTDRLHAALNKCSESITPPQRRGVTRDFDTDDDASLVSQLTPTPTAPSSISSAIDIHATLSRVALQAARPSRTDVSLPDFHLISVGEKDSAPPATLRMLSAGDSADYTGVWQQLACGWTMLPAVEMDERDARKCFFCTRTIKLGAPIIVLQHVCDPEGQNQNVKLSVCVACTQCRDKRTVPMRHRRSTVSKTLRRVSRTFVIEAFTMHLRYALAQAQDTVARYRVEVIQPKAYCDACYDEIAPDELTAVVAARRLHTNELFLFVTCMHKKEEDCETTLRGILEQRTRPSKSPPLASKGSETLGVVWSNPDLPEIRLTPDSYEDTVHEWRVLSAGEFDCMMKPTDGSEVCVAGLPPGTIIHRCRSNKCLCKDTHRGAAIRRHANLSSSPDPTPRLDDAYLIKRIYDSFIGCHLYTDILRSDENSRCACCKAPCTNLCTMCRAVRFCSSECQQRHPAAMAVHRQLCRPYTDAWTPLQLR